MCSIIAIVYTSIVCVQGPFTMMVKLKSRSVTTKPSKVHITVPLWRDRWIPHSLQGRHNERDSVSNHQPHECLLNRLFRRRSKKTSKLHVTGLCVGNSPGPVNSPHKGPVTRKMFPFVDVIMLWWEPPVTDSPYKGPAVRQALLCHGSILVFRVVFKLWFGPMSSKVFWCSRVWERS